jgi:lysophospholipase L1-like esterase
MLQINMVKILVFGDSIAWGMFDPKKGGWVERLKINFFQTFKDKGVGVYNFSVSSNDTRGVLKFLKPDIIKIKSIEDEEFILLFSIGINDSRYVNEPNNIFIREKEFKENLQKIIDIAKKYSARIFFTGLIKIDEKLTKPWNENEFWENKNIENYDRIIFQKCNENNINFIPLFNSLNETELLDGLHPNIKGHEKIFKHIKTHLLSEI